MKKNKSYKAQILIILLIVLAILSIFVVVVATTARRDVVESVQNKQYEQALSLAEDTLLKILEQDQDLLNDPDYLSNCVEINNTIDCTISREPESGFDAIDIDIHIENDSEVINLPVEKDRNVKFLLNNYSGPINMSWTGSTSWMITLDYQNSAGEYLSYKDVWDEEGTPDLFGSNELSCLGTTYDSVTHILSFDISSFADPDPNGCGVANIDAYLALRLKPISMNQQSTDLSLNATGPGFPEQVRNYKVSGHFVGEDLKDTPFAQVELVEPLYESPLEILDYVLRTEQQVEK